MTGKMENHPVGTTVLIVQCMAPVTGQAGNRAMYESLNLSSANIRFLLAVRFLIENGEKPGCARLAEFLKCKKSSTHNMIRYLEEKGLLKYETGTAPEYTTLGREVADSYYNIFMKLLDIIGIKDDEITDNFTAVCSFIADAGEAIIKRIIG